MLKYLCVNLTSGYHKRVRSHIFQRRIHSPEFLLVFSWPFLGFFVTQQFTIFSWIHAMAMVGIWYSDNIFSRTSFGRNIISVLRCCKNEITMTKNVQRMKNIPFVYHYSRLDYDTFKGKVSYRHIMTNFVSFPRLQLEPL